MKDYQDLLSEELETRQKHRSKTPLLKFTELTKKILTEASTMTKNDKLLAFAECYAQFGSNEGQVMECMGRWQNLYGYFGSEEMQRSYKSYLKSVGDSGK